MQLIYLVLVNLNEDVSDNFLENLLLDKHLICENINSIENNTTNCINMETHNQPVK